MTTAVAILIMAAAVAAALRDNLETGAVAQPSALVLLGVAAVIAAGLWSQRGRTHRKTGR